ncbi:MAG: VanZ family protein [Lachnospiraceae bacterium]|nr:VanZ family protein [Lachnospiraceae bacterium]
METAYYILDYYFSAVHWFFLFMVFTASIAVSMVIAKRRWTHSILISLFVTYIFFILLITLIVRTPASSPKAELIPFWSWYDVIVHHDLFHFKEILLNILLFVPVGLFFSLLFRIKTRIAFFIGFGLSAIIELSQLITCRGLFEWDDMLHNGLGCMIGAALAGIVLRVWRLRRH